MPKDPPPSEEELRAGARAFDVVLPTAVPGKAPVAFPGQRPFARHVAIPGCPTGATGTPVYRIILSRPTPRPHAHRAPSTTTPASVRHHPDHRSEPRKHRHVAASPGRHEQHDLPAFREDATGDLWDCVASGFGQRRALPTERGTALSAGALRHLGSVDAIARDVPARHPEHAGCVISVKRRDR